MSDNVDGYMMMMMTTTMMMMMMTIMMLTLTLMMLMMMIMMMVMAMRMIMLRTTAAHTLCEPAQPKCTWTCHKSHLMREFTSKMPPTKTGDRTGDHSLGEHAQLKCN